MKPYGIEYRRESCLIHRHWAYEVIHDESLRSLHRSSKECGFESHGAFRISVGANSINSGQQLCTIQFGSEYRTRDSRGRLAAAQPVVLVNSALNRLYAEAITSTGFSLFNAAVLPANTSVDVFVSARCE